MLCFFRCAVVSAFVLLSCLCASPYARAQDTRIDPELLDLHREEVLANAPCSPWKEGQSRRAQGPCWGDRSPTYDLQVHGGGGMTLVIPGLGFGMAGAGLRLARVRPIKRIGEFHLRPGFMMGAAYPPLCDPGCPHAEGVGRVWTLDLDLAVGFRSGIWFFSVGPTLGIAVVRGLEPSPYGENGAADASETVVHPVISVATFDLGLAFSRRYPVRLGVRVTTFLSMSGSAYVSFPLHAPFEKLGQR